MLRSRLFPSRLLLAIALALCCALPPAAMAADAQSARFYEDALQRFERKDFNGSIVQLKNALQNDPNMLSAQVLLGKALLKNGDLPGAQVNLEKALALGADRAEVVVPLALAYGGQGKAALLLERIGPDGLPLKVRIEVLVLRANAEAELGNHAAAERLFDEARALDNRAVSPRLAQATYFVRIGQMKRAVAALDELLQITTSDSGVWNLRASIAQLQGDLDGALRDYDRAVKLDTTNIDAQVARAGLLLSVGRRSDADEAIDAIRRQSPREPRAAYLSAVSASLANEPDRVRDALAEVVSLLDPVPKEMLARQSQLLLLGGLAHYGLGNAEKATAYLELELKSNAKDVGAAKLLASIYLDRGEVSRALGILEPLNRANPSDLQLASLLAAAQMRDRRWAAAAALLENAVRQSAGAPNLRTDWAVSLIQSGQPELGMKQLQDALAKDPSQTRAATVLGTLYLKQKQPKRAIELFEGVIRREPRDPVAQNLLGVARAAAGDSRGARAAYEAALRVDARFSPATLNLARLDVEEGADEAARTRLDELLRVDARNADAMFELARLEERTGRPTEAVRWLERAMAAPRQRVRAGVLLTEVLVRQQQAGRAVTVARDIAANAPKDVSALLALGRAELANGNVRGAHQALSTLRPLLGFDPARNTEIARLYIAAGDRDGAVYSLDKALQANPAYLDALVLQAELEIEAREYAKAEARARTIGQKHPASPAGMRLLGDIAMARGQFAAAVTNYRAALAKEFSVDLAMRTYRAYLSGGDRAKALSFLEQYERGHAENWALARAVADATLAAGNLTAARSRYERLLAQHPRDADVLNNLAQVALKQGDPAAALNYAQRAYDLARTDPLILDTLGWILVRRGEIGQGVGLLRDARTRDSANPEIRYHLAAALARSGREAEARDELAALLAEGTVFDGVEDARQLHHQLGR